MKASKALLVQCMGLAVSKLGYAVQSMTQTENCAPVGTLTEELVGEFYLWLAFGLGKHSATQVPDSLQTIRSDDLCWPIRLPRTGYVHETNPKLPQLMIEQRPVDTLSSRFAVRWMFWRLGLAIERLGDGVLELGKGGRRETTRVQALLESAIWNVNHAWNGRYLSRSPEEDDWPVYGSAPPELQAPDVLVRLQANELRVNKYRESTLRKLRLGLPPDDYRKIATLWSDLSS